MLLEVVHIRYQFARRTFAGTESNCFRPLIDSHQINFGVCLVPETLNSMSDWEIAYRFATAFLIKLASQFLSETAFDFCKSLIGFFYEFVEWSKGDRGNGIGQSRKPGTEEIVRDVVSAAFRFWFCEHRQLRSISPNRSMRTFKVPELPYQDFRWLPDGLHEFVVHRPGFRATNFNTTSYRPRSSRRNQFSASDRSGDELSKKIAAAASCAPPQVPPCS